jgi:hypothetical protein
MVRKTNHEGEAIPEPPCVEASGIPDEIPVVFLEHGRAELQVINGNPARHFPREFARAPAGL